MSDPHHLVEDQVNYTGLDGPHFVIAHHPNDYSDGKFMVLERCSHHDHRSMPCYQYFADCNWMPNAKIITRMLNQDQEALQGDDH